MAGSWPTNIRFTTQSYLLPISSGFLLILAFPRFEQGYLAWVALFPLIWFTINNPPRKAATGGFLYAVPITLYLNFYLATLLYDYLPPLLAVFSTAALVALVSLFSALFAAGASRAARLYPPLTLTFVLPSLWVLLEYTRSLGFTGYNVGYLGYSQWQYPLLLNITATYGYWGLPFLMVGLQCLVLMAGSRRLSGRKLLIGTVIWLALAGVGLFLPTTFTREEPTTPTWAALIQGNSSPEEVLSEGGKQLILKRYIKLTRRAVTDEPRVKLVVWPETVVDLAGPAPVHKTEMINLAQELEINLLYGARVLSEGRLYNSILALPEGGGGITFYHKHRLVPFVEYFPAERLLNSMLNLDIKIGGYTAGKSKPTIFNLSGIPLAGVICFESYFGDHTRRFARDGARHLFILTNDAWFEKSISLEQHAQVAALRAAESGIGVTQVANSGITLSFDHRGKELFRSPKLTEKIIIAPLSTGGRSTLYRRWGNYLPAFCGFYLLLLGGTTLYRRLRP